MKVYIIEDHPSVFQILKLILEEMGGHLEIVNFPEWTAAVKAIASSPPDFVITDIQIGDFKQLNTLTECYEKKIPCMVFSSYINSTILGQCERHKARVVVSKSSSIEELKIGLQSLIGHRWFQCSACQSLTDSKRRLSEEIPKVIFTPAEEFVILAQIEGKTTVELSKETKKSKYTLRNQRMKLMEKNGCTMEEIVRRYLFWHTKG